MQEAIRQPTDGSEATDGLAAAALRAESWSGEPFLRPGEDPAEVLGEGHARREALEDALAEMEAGLESPSAPWKVHYSLMLGLERVIADHPARLASGTELRRHQIDALAGMLTELISRNERHEENGNGLNGDEDDFEEELDEPIAVDPGEDDDLEPEIRPEDDPGAERRFRFRHPTASGKTIAAAGFVEAARTMGILILTHRRLLRSEEAHV